MAEVHAEGKRHQQIVQVEVRELLRRGCPPEQISISGIQNPDLENWAKKKGIVFDPKQKVDLIAANWEEEE